MVGINTPLFKYLSNELKQWDAETHAQMQNTPG